MQQRTYLLLVLNLLAQFPAVGWAQPSVILDGSEAKTGRVEFHVSTKGSDHGSGTKDQPFATIHQAQKTLRRVIQAGLKSDARVVIGAGVHELATGLEMGTEDGGTAACSVTYEAQAGGRVVLSGGRRITGWKVRSDGLWTVELPEVKAGKWNFRQLFVNGKRAIRARTPNISEVEPYLRLTGAEITPRTNVLHLPAGTLRQWKNLSTVEVTVIGNWDITRKRIQSLDESTGTMRLQPPYLRGNSLIRPQPGMACYFENASEFLDQPGEWFLDTNSGLLSYMPLPGEALNSTEVIAPRLTSLLRVDGAGARPVRNLHFKGLTFAHVEWALPEEGYNGVQAGTFFQTGENDDSECLWSGRMPAALEWTFAESCSIENGVFEHLGGAGVALRKGCNDNRVEANEFRDIAGNAMMVGEDLFGSYYLKKPAPPANEVPKRNRVAKNHVHNCASDYPGCVGIWAAYTDGTIISSNLVHDMPYTGISLGFYWGTAPTVCRSNVVEFNHVYDVMKIAADGGAIYTLGVQPGTVLRGNVLHDVHRSSVAHGGAPNNGIFFDEGSSKYLIESNTIYNTSGDPIRFNQTSREALNWGTNDFGAAQKFE